MVYNFINDDEIKYTEEVRKYVDGAILPSLSMGYDLDTAREQSNLVLLRTLLENADLRSQVVNKIVEYGIQFSMLSYKNTLSDNLRQQVFMKRIYSFLDYNQISLLVKMFMQKIALEENQKHSR